MAGIAGIASEGAVEKVRDMLEKIRYRGRSGISVFEKDGTTLGMVWNEPEKETADIYISSGEVGDDIGRGHCARVRPEKGKFILYRDELGVAPLYYGRDNNGNICFSSEIKALLPVTWEIRELPPGHLFNGNSLKPYFRLEPGVKSGEDPVQIAGRLKELLGRAVADCIRSDDFGSWLSGGLDSSTICALAVGHVKKLRTFSAGLRGAPDLEYAREMADFIKSDHHEIVVTLDEMIAILPQVIYHLESFDALLVRSTITNYLVAKLASDHVSELFSGEGGDELFAGYEYLKSIKQKDLEDELISLTGSLHNTAFQRVDRCAAAHGTSAHIIFADPDVVRYAFMIPDEFKIRDNVEKWILRKAMEGDLPDKILKRPKAKFWEGAGISEVISGYSEEKITDHDFRSGRLLPGGFRINTKEELYYYRIFREHFGTDFDLSMMGRTRGSPVS